MTIAPADPVSAGLAAAEPVPADPATETDAPGTALLRTLTELLDQRAPAVPEGVAAAGEPGVVRLA